MPAFLRSACRLGGAFALVFLACAGRGQSQTSGNKKLVERIVADENTAIRFFYDPPGGDYFHVPLVFRPVKNGDSRLNTAPILEEGRTAFFLLRID